MRALSRFTVDFLRTEAGAGFILAAGALLAILWANSPWGAAYADLIGFGLPGPAGHDWPLSEWVKEGLMTIFFFVVGLEIKHELRHGELSNPKTLALPVMAALGGMIVPALIYLAVNIKGDLRGWPVPVATDIAFALAVLAMVARDLPPSLRVFLLTLAIVDDLGAVAIIAVVFHSAFDAIWLGAMAAGLIATCAVRFTPRRLHKSLYLVLAVAVWFASLRAGISPSLAGVAAALTVRTPSIHGLTRAIHPFVAYMVLPLFAFTASGLSLAGMTLSSLLDPRFLGVVLGLFVGKPLGVFAAARTGIAFGWAHWPEGSTLRQRLGVCLLCGIGFTMSLFLADLAFANGDKTTQNAVKTGIAAASLLSACAGAAILRNRARGEFVHQ